jgi:uncharacterized protein (DUF169 family)
MESIEKYQQTGKDIWNALRLPTHPVAIKYIKDETEIPENFIRPSKIGESWSLCQAITYARRNQEHSAMTKEDNFCIPSSFGQGWLKVTFDEFIESQILNKWRKDYDSEIRCQMAFAADFASEENLKKSSEYIGFLVAPLTSTCFVPDSILIYSDPGQATHIIQALSYEGKHVITSIFNGFGESCMKGALKPFLTGKPQVIIPGAGDKAISGTADDEIAVAIPGHLLFYVKENLFKTAGEKNMGYPYEKVRGQIDHTFLPGWEYLHKKV